MYFIYLVSRLLIQCCKPPSDRQCEAGSQQVCVGTSPPLGLFAHLIGESWHLAPHFLNAFAHLCLLMRLNDVIYFMYLYLASQD